MVFRKFYSSTGIFQLFPLLITRKVLHCFSCCPSTENYNQKPHNVVSYQYFIFGVVNSSCVLVKSQKLYTLRKVVYLLGYKCPSLGCFFFFVPYNFVPFKGQFCTPRNNCAHCKGTQLYLSSLGRLNKQTVLQKLAYSYDILFIFTKIIDYITP